MEILPFEEVERVAGAKMQKGGVTCLQQYGYYNSSTPVHGFLEDSSDEDDYMAPLLPKSEEGSVCCVCGENIPLLNKLIEHFKMHTDEVYCHICQTKFGRVMSLALHLKNAHPSQSFMCGICRALFRCSWHLNGHMEKHQKGAMPVKPVGKMEPTEEISIKENKMYTEMRKIVLWDHSYCVSDQAATNVTCRNHIENDTDSTNQVSHIKTETERLPIIDKQNDTCSLSQSEQEHVSFRMKEENEDEDENGLGETIVYEVAAEEEIGLTEDDLSTDTEDDVNPDSLPPGDTAYNPDEDFSSEPDSDSRSNSYDRHRKKKRRKTQTPNSKKPANRNLDSADIAEKFGFQSDSPFCCYGKFANLGKHMDDCRNKPRSACRLCNTVCENEKMLLKHTTEKHPAGYICSRCHSVFPRLDHFKNHVCLRRTTGGMNLPATLVTQIPVVPLSNSSGQLRPSAPALYTNPNSSKVIKMTQTVNKVSPAPVPPPLMLQPLLHPTPSVPAKVTNLVPQVMAVPQTLIRPHFPQMSCVARPKVPVHVPPVVRPLIPNLARMTLRIPTPSNTPFPSQVIVSFSPTVNVSAPCVVSASRPVLRQTPLANIRPIPVNVPLMASVTCPTLVSALTENKPQVPPAQVQAPLQIVGMFVNRNSTEVIQKRLEQSWRTKTIFPCRHCGAVSRQPSLKVRHRYLHRGSRLYRCQCGRSFQRQLHLLRHQVQHAESVRFVCARCGNTFEGAHKLTWHKQKHRNGRRCAKKKCKAAFDCSSCGQMFTRPSALLWHMLKNSKLSKHTRKNSQSVSV